MRERSRALWTRLGQLDPRWPVSFLITLVLVLGEARYGILGGYDRLAVALGVCVATELALSRWVQGRLANPQSAYITGISLALLIKPRVDLLAVRAGRLPRDRLEVRAAVPWPAPLEPEQLCHRPARAGGAGERRHPEPPMGQRPGHERGDLVFWAPHRDSSPQGPRHGQRCCGLR